MKQFRTFDGERVDLIDYTIKMLSIQPNLRIYIGTDSQNYGGVTKFVTSVCYRWENQKGAHVIYLVQKDPRIRDHYTRLYTEGIKTMEILSEFDDYPIKIYAVEFDYNNTKPTISSKLINDFRGWCEGIGQKSTFKGDELLATKASDNIVRSGR